MSLPSAPCGALICLTFTAQAAPSIQPSIAQQLAFTPLEADQDTTELTILSDPNRQRDEVVISFETLQNLPFPAMIERTLPNGVVRTEPSVSAEITVGGTLYELQAFAKPGEDQIAFRQYNPDLKELRPKLAAFHQALAEDQRLSVVIVDKQSGEKVPLFDGVIARQ